MLRLLYLYKVKLFVERMFPKIDKYLSKKVAGKISIVIGPPINGADAKEITKKAQLWISQTYKKIN